LKLDWYDLKNPIQVVDEGSESLILLQCQSDRVITVGKINGEEITNAR